MQKAMSFEKEKKSLIKSPTKILGQRKFGEEPTPGYTPGYTPGLDSERAEEGYNFRDDYSSSDYDYISDEEIKYM